ncbi:MAG: hypothetical protein WCG75_07175 [Armatimonadota bacterium]
MSERKFSTVEMTVLGMTWLRGPCTIYAVMKELSSSASTFHKSRAGTAYSISKRFLDLGLIEKLNTELVQVTKSGEDLLRKWTGPVVPMNDVAHSADLLRLRFFFLEILPQQERLEFVDRSIESLKIFQDRCEKLIAKNEEIGDYFGALATVCSVLEARARIEWLHMVRDLVEHPLPPGTSWTEAINSRLNCH